MSSKITTEKYDIVKMERLRHYLETSAERDKPRYYEIFVDNLKAVDKTNDPACFDDYAMYMNEDSRMIKVLIYTCAENSPRNDKFIFTITNVAEEKRKEERQQAELNGLDVQNKINTAITAERERLNTARLKDALEDKIKQLEDAEEYIEQLQEELEVLRQKKYNPREINFGNVASIAIEEIIKRNPVWTQKVPLIGALSGLMGTEQADDQEGTEKKTPREETTAASFSKKTEEATEEPLDKEIQAKLEFFQQLESVFADNELSMVVDILHALMANPAHLTTVHELLLPHENPDKKAA